MRIIKPLGLLAAPLALAALALAALGAGAAEAKTVWLCKPGQSPNPCRETLKTTIRSPNGGSRVERPRLAHKPKIDCFYVYPTVSMQEGPNADRSIDPEQTAIARYQAARFSQRCRVYAPIYRQLTLDSIGGGGATPAAVRRAYRDVRSAWRDYLRNHNRGRGFVLIGHSQGTAMLTKLIRDAIDERRRVRRRLVSALLLGGNVMTAKGEPAGGSFENVPVCERRRQIGCVIAYSVFNETPPDDAAFGRANTGFARLFGLPDSADFEVACTNPGKLKGGPSRLKTYARTEPFPGLLGAGLTLMYGGPPPTAPTPWVQPRDRYTGKCVRRNGAHVLMLSPVGDARRLNPSPNAAWGLHLADVNIALGNLVNLVGVEKRAYRKRRG